MKVLVVEDHAIVFSGCRALFADDPDIDLVEARSVASARDQFDAVEPDIVIIDINLPDGSGLDLTRELLAHNRDTKIVVFSMSDAPMLAMQAIEYGAKGYVSKNGDPGELREAVFALQNGKRWLPPELVQEMALVSAGVAHIPKLSDREVEVLRGLARGRSMAETAGELGVSYKTIASDCSVLRSKLNARTSSEMVRIAAELKLV